MSKSIWQPIDGQDGIDSHVRQPSAADCRRMVVEVQARLGWSNRRMGNYVGVGECVWEHWRNRMRNPHNAARRLIWWFWCSICAPQHLDHPFAWLLWGGVQESEGMAKARAVTAACAKGKYPPYEDRRRKSKRPISNPGASKPPEK